MDVLLLLVEHNNLVVDLPKGALKLSLLLKCSDKCLAHLHKKEQLPLLLQYLVLLLENEDVKNRLVVLSLLPLLLLLHSQLTRAMMLPCRCKLFLEVKFAEPGTATEEVYTTAFRTVSNNRSNDNITTRTISSN
jgi:hypothetical protein